MIKIDYTFYAKTPIHTGSDENLGTMKSLRRQKLVLLEPKQYESQYDDKRRIDAIVELLYVIHKAINWDAIKRRRRMGIWDEQYSKLLKAATAANKYQFLETLCRNWDIRSLKSDTVLDILESLNDIELLDTVRSETQYLILRLRRRTKDKQGSPLFDNVRAETGYKYVKTWEQIPCISGNSIRGVLRRLLMRDFCSRVGIKKMSKDMYHILFTGGMLTDSTRYEDVDRRERLIDLCPPLGVLGAAIGNMTIQGLLSVGIAYPHCRELGTGDQSYWEYLETVFQTRRDSSKEEKEIEIEGDSENPAQMKYEYEVFAPGTPFVHGFRMADFDELSRSCFWHMIELFKENPIVGGLQAVGNALVDLHELPSSSGQEYVDYINKNRAEIHDEFSIE